MHKLANQANYRSQIPPINNYSDFNEEDALMINEDENNEFSNENGQINGSLCLKNPISLEQFYTNIDNLMNTKLLIDDILNNNECEKDVRFMNCLPNLDSLCFGHIKNIIKLDALRQIDSIDHTKFELSTKLNDNFTFVKGESCFIGFTVPNSKFNSESEKLYNNLKIDISDPFKKLINFEIKEKINEDIRIMKIYFKPSNTGIYEMTMTYKKKNITNSPFHFAVLPYKLYENNVNNEMSNIDANNMDTVTPKPNITTKLSNSSSFSIGRGRLLRINEQNRIPAVNHNKNYDNRSSSALALIDLVGPAQKRKSPANNFNDNDQEMETFDTPITDLSKKFNSFSCENTSSNNLNIAQNNNKANLTSPSLNIISNHLRKHVKGLISLNEIPPLKAMFLVKFEKCNFPIGVRPTKCRNFLIVCDSGANSIKLFNNATGKLVHEIRDKLDLYTLRRPSAVLVNNENNQEIFVKDDKEILVFDLSDDIKFVRKFGFKILTKPYGLAFDSQGNLVLVNADLKNAQILTFNKENGELINARLYEPISDFARSNSLITTFNNVNTRHKSLSDNLFQLEKTKIRFLCSNQNFVYASDLGRSIVYKTNLDGEMQLAFGHFGKKKGEICEPSGIFVDDDGHAILVGDSKNDRLQVTFYFTFINFTIVI